MAPETAVHIIDPNVLRITYRLLHLLGMAVLVGGAVAVAMHGSVRDDEQRGVAPRDGVVAGGAARAAATPIDVRTMLAAAARYERLFWPVLMVQVLTGVGNVGVMGSRAPGTGGPWGDLFGTKLLLVGVVLAASFVRTGVVALRLADPYAGLSARGARVLRIGYGATAVALGVIVLLAIGMAHG